MAACHFRRRRRRRSSAPCSLLHAPCSLLLAPCSLLPACSMRRAPCPHLPPAVLHLHLHALPITPMRPVNRHSACLPVPHRLWPPTSLSPSAVRRLRLAAIVTYLAPIVGVTCGSHPQTVPATHCHSGNRPSQAARRLAILGLLTSTLCPPATAVSSAPSFCPPAPVDT